MTGYSTATAVANLLNTTFSGATATQANAILTRVKDRIDQQTGRAWSSATTSEYHDVRSAYDESETYFPHHNIQRSFFLKNYPVISVQSVQENVAGLTGESWTTRSSGYAGDYLFRAAEGIIEFHKTFPSAGRRNLKVIYTFGVDTIPADIKYASELYAASEMMDYIKRASDQEGLASVSIGNVSYNFSDLKRQSDRYRGDAMAIVAGRGYWFKAEGR